MVRSAILVEALVVKTACKSVGGRSLHFCAVFTRELAAAYHMDEASATSRDVQRMAEKVRARMGDPNLDEEAKPTAPPTPCE